MAEDDRGAVSGGAEALSEEDHSPEALEDNITLSFLDKLKCMMYSKVERDAFLIEKLEKEEKKKAKEAESAADGGKKKKKKKKTLFGQLKSVFATPEERHDFLQRQVTELERKQRQEKGQDLSPDADVSATARVPGGETTS